MVWRFWLTLFGVAFVSINLYLAAAVYVDAKKRRFDRINLPPGWWALATFFFSLWGFCLLGGAPLDVGRPGTTTALLSVDWGFSGHTEDNSWY